MPTCPANKEGFTIANFSRTCCQVRACCAKTHVENTAATSSIKNRRGNKRFMTPPPLIKNFCLPGHSCRFPPDRKALTQTRQLNDEGNLTSRSRREGR